MNSVDIILIAVLLLSSLVGALRGFLVEVMSLVVWIAAFWLAFKYGDAASGLFVAFVDSPAALLFLGYATLFIGALVIGGWSTWALSKLLKKTGLSGVDRLLGTGFGFLRGIALCCFGVLILGFSPLPQNVWWAQSQLLPNFIGGAQWLQRRLPEDVASQVQLQATPPTNRTAQRGPTEPDEG